MKKKGRNAVGGPKLPLNPYMEFFAEERLKIMEETKNISTLEISRIAGQRWKNLNSEEKLKYAEKYKVNLSIYKQKVQEFNDNNAINGIIAKTGAKQPLNPYLEFARVERPKILAELGNLSVSEVGRELGKRWASLDKVGRSVFVEKSKVNRESYKQMKSGVLAPVSTGSSESRIYNLNSNSSTSTVLIEADTVSTSSRSCRSECQEEVEQPTDISLNDLGFAKQRGYEWHPALKNTEIARGSRLKVTFFGTGDSCFVDKCDWVQFSEEAKLKVRWGVMVEHTV